MTHLELALTSLSEATAITLHQNRDSQGFPKLRQDAVDAGAIGGEARRLIEQRINQPVVSSQNHLSPSKGKKKQQLPPPDSHQQRESEPERAPLKKFHDPEQQTSF